MIISVGKKLIAIIVMCAFAFCLTACASEQKTEDADKQEAKTEEADKQSEEKQELEPLELGKAYTYKDIYGIEYFSVAVEGVVYDKKQTADMKEYGHINDNEAIYVALLKVKNISGEPESFLPINQAVLVKDVDGVSLTPANSGFDYGQYTATLSSGIYDMPKGKTGRYGLILIGPKGLDKVDVELMYFAEGSVPVE